MKQLRISKSLSLPISFTTWTQAILGQKGGGKSYKASVEAEELLDAGQQVVIIDPTSVWWGLRASADGKRDGYPITIIGGEHADVPLEATAGELLATAIVSERFSAIIDLGLFTKGEENRFCAAFLETLYRKNREPMHLFLDEADVYAPQKPFGEESRTLGACQSIVRRGRAKGIGCTLITQRPQVLNKDVLSQADMLTALRMSHPKDLGAIQDWITVHGDPARAKEMIASLPSLPVGEAWVWSPGHHIFDRVTFRDRRTFDSGATPKAGERRLEPKRLAKIDHDKLGAAIAATVERAKESDPKHLRAQVAELRRQLEAKPAGDRDALAAKVAELRKRKPITDAQIKRVEAAIEREVLHLKRLDSAATVARAYLDELRELLTAWQPSRVDERQDAPAPAAARWQPARAVPRAAPAPAARDASRAAAAQPSPRTSGQIGAGERAVLTAVLGRPSGISQAEIAVLTGYKKTSRATYLQKLRAAGFVENAGALVRPTPAGFSAMPEFDPLPTGAKLREHWLARLPEGERRVLETLIIQYPHAMAHTELEERTGYKKTSRATYLQKLRARQLVETGREGARASAILFEEPGK